MNNPPDLDELEEQTRVRTREKERETLLAVASLLNQYLSGFQQIGNFQKTAANRNEEVWLYLTVRAFNSLRQAYSLLETGYYSQSLMLIRATFEDWLVCEDSKLHTDTIDAILTENKPMPRVSEMVNRLEDSLKEQMGDVLSDGGIYGILSTFTHPRYQAAAVLVDPESNVISLGPIYDERLFVFVSNYLMSVSVRMTEFLVRLVGFENAEWLANSNRVVNKAIECRELIVERAKSLL